MFPVNDAAALVLMVALLGLRHGLDPDHLATIDGLIRHNSTRNPRLSRWSGFLFSLGHGAVVTLVAGLVAATMYEGSAPAWLELAGAWISIAFLLILGAANLLSVFRTPADQLVRPVGLKGRWLGRLAQTGHPAVITSIGAAFALSFDTVSQTAMFSLTGAHVAGWPFSVGLGVVFTLGMVATDTGNGLWVARILQRADARARTASRILCLGIAVLGIAIAALGVARLASRHAAAALAGTELAIGLTVVAGVAVTSWIAMHLARRKAA